MRLRIKILATICLSALITSCAEKQNTISIDVDSIREIAKKAAYEMYSGFVEGDLVEPEIQKHMILLRCDEITNECYAQMEYQVKSMNETILIEKDSGICVHRHYHTSFYVYVYEDGHTEVKGPSKGYSPEVVDCKSTEEAVPLESLRPCNRANIIPGSTEPSL